MVGAVSSVQFGAAFAKSIFDEIGPGGTVFLRMLFAALVLMAIWRPRVRGHSRRDLILMVLFGASLAGMNATFYAALDRIPLGVAVTFEFVGPLSVAVFGSRKRLDLAWAALAAAGIVLLSDFGGADLDGLGVALALTAGAFWAAYILLAARVGQVFPGGDGLALAMLVAVVPLAPLGIADGGSDLLVAGVLAVGFAVGHAVVGDPLHARAGGAAPAARKRLRGADEPGAGGGRHGRVHRARRGPGRARDRGDPAGGRGERGRRARGEHRHARRLATRYPRR